VRVRQDFYLAGVEDLWNGDPDIPQAIAGSREGDFVLLLAHNPDTTMTQDTTGVDLVLSGHTHGGQVTIFGLWAPLFAIDEGITAYDQRFRSGWSTSRDDVPVYVSNGTGQYATRVFARPQVIILTLG
jgi:predicted MPP superfamily phosphohydrolase